MGKVSQVGISSSRYCQTRQSLIVRNGKIDKDKLATKSLSRSMLGMIHRINVLC